MNQGSPQLLHIREGSWVVVVIGFLDSTRVAEVDTNRDFSCDSLLWVDPALVEEIMHVQNTDAVEEVNYVIYNFWWACEEVV